MTTNPEAGMRPATSQASWANDPRMTAAEASPLNAIRYAVESWEEYGDPADAMTFLEMWEQGDLSESQQYREWCLAAAPVAPAGSDDWSDLLQIVEETPENGYEVDHRYIDAVLPSVVRRLILAARAQPPGDAHKERRETERRLLSRDLERLAQPPVGEVVAWVDGRVLEQLGKTHACATTNLWKSQPTITHVPLYAHPTEPAARDGGEAANRPGVVAAYRSAAPRGMEG